MLFRWENCVAKLAITCAKIKLLVYLYFELLSEVNSFGLAEREADTGVNTSGKQNFINCVVRV